MPTQPINVIQEPLTPEQLSEELAKLQKLLRYLLNGQLDFENVRARSIKAENIEVGTLTAEEIAANTITAEKMNVTELSAISANLGHITAGLIEAITMIGSLIQTRAAGNYPRIELSSSQNLLKAENSPSESVSLYGSFDGTPMLRFIDIGVGLMQFVQSGSLFSMFGVGNININTTSGRIDIDAPGGVYANGIRVDVIPPPPTGP